jgi:hypothetical protein
VLTSLNSTDADENGRSPELTSDSAVQEGHPRRTSDSQEDTEDTEDTEHTEDAEDQEDEKDGQWLPGAGTAPGSARRPKRK